MKNYKSILYIIMSALLFAFAINVFMLPISIYSSGMFGLAQLFSDGIVYVFNLKLNFNITGITYFIFNIPIFIFAWKKLSVNFVKLSFLHIICQTIFLAIIPIPETPLVKDIFVSILLAATIGSYGVSLAYKVKASGGGLDIIGFYISMKNLGSMGLVYKVVNFFIYTICLFAYNVETAIYSFVLAFIFAFLLDRFHSHNIDVSVMIFTNNPDMKQELIRSIHRGVTHWDGYGAYTGKKLDILITIVSEAEITELKRLIKKIDPKAFAFVTKNLQVYGGYEKRLI